MSTTYFKGDLAEYTGKSTALPAHGMLPADVLYEVRLLEGHLAGQVRLVRAAPSEQHSEPAPADPYVACINFETDFPDGGK